MIENAFERIVIATDGSADSLAATRIGAQIALAHNSKVVLVHAAAMPPLMPNAAPPPEYMAYLDEIAEQAVNGSEKILSDYGVAAETVIRRQGPAADVIMTVAEERAADLIVVGHRGLGAFGRLFLGSVSNRIVHEAKQAVLVAPVAEAPRDDAA